MSARSARCATTRAGCGLPQNQKGGAPGETPPRLFSIHPNALADLSGFALQRWAENAPNFRIAPYQDLTTALNPGGFF